jgi:hypothetical protein
MINVMNLFIYYCQLRLEIVAFLLIFTFYLYKFNHLQEMEEGSIFNHFNLLFSYLLCLDG